MSYLVHHGIKGQKWGVRRYQNPDGSYTEAGRERYRSSGSKQLFANAKKKMSDLYRERGLELNKVSDESEKRINKRFREELGMDPDEAYRKASDQNDLLDSGKLSYDKSIWKKINDIEDTEYYTTQIEETKISDEYAKKMAAVGESFLDDYMKSKNIDSVSYDEISKLGNKEYNHEHQEWYSDPYVEQLFNVIDRSSSKYETGYIDKNGSMTDDWRSGDYGIRRKKKG